MAPRRGTSITIRRNMSLDQMEKEWENGFEARHPCPTHLTKGLTNDQRIREEVRRISAEGRENARSALSNLPDGFRVGKDVA